MISIKATKDKETLSLFHWIQLMLLLILNRKMPSNTVNKFSLQPLDSCCKATRRLGVILYMKLKVSVYSVFIDVTTRADKYRP